MSEDKLTPQAQELWEARKCEAIASVGADLHTVNIRIIAEDGEELASGHAGFTDKQHLNSATNIAVERARMDFEEYVLDALEAATP